MCSKFFFYYLSHNIRERFFIFIYFFAWRRRCIENDSSSSSISLHDVGGVSCTEAFQFRSSRWLLWIQQGNQYFKHLIFLNRIIESKKLLIWEHLSCLVWTKYLEEIPFKYHFPLKEIILITRKIYPVTARWYVFHNRDLAFTMEI